MLRRKYTGIFGISLGIIFGIILFHKRKWYASDKPQSSFRIESGGRVESRRRFWALSLVKILAHLGERALVYSPLNSRRSLRFRLRPVTTDRRIKDKNSNLSFRNSERKPEKRANFVCVWQKNKKKLFPPFTNFGLNSRMILKRIYLQFF